MNSNHETRQSAALHVIARRFGTPASSAQADAYQEMAEQCAVNALSDDTCKATAETVCDGFEKLRRQMSAESQVPYWLAPVFSNCQAH